MHPLLFLFNGLFIFFVLFFVLYFSSLVKKFQVYLYVSLILQFSDCFSLFFAKTFEVLSVYVYVCVWLPHEYAMHCKHPPPSFKSCYSNFKKCKFLAQIWSTSHHITFVQLLDMHFASTTLQRDSNSGHIWIANIYVSTIQMLSWVISRFLNALFIMIISFIRTVRLSIWIA